MGNCCYSFDHEVVDGIISMRLLAIIWVWEDLTLPLEEFLNSGLKKNFAENFNLL